MDIFDLKKIDTFNLVLKVCIWIAAGIVVVVTIKDKIKASSTELVEDIAIVEEISNRLTSFEEQAKLFDSEGIVYSTICLIAKDKGAKLVTPNIVKKSLTEEEAIFVANIVEKIYFSGQSQSEIMENMSDRAYLVDFYGFDNANYLFGIANAHLKEWGAN